MFPGHYVFHCQGTDWGQKLALAGRRVRDAVYGTASPTGLSDQALRLQEILADPGHDEHRLNYADWLIQRNDPRGQFIRLQCELERMLSGQQSWSAERALEKALFAEHGEEWSTPFHDLGVNWCGFRRGFVEKVVMPAREFRYEGEALFQLAPIQSADLSGDGFTAEHAAELAECPVLEKFYYLRMYDVHQDTVDPLLHSPRLVNLRGLDLCANYLPGLPTDIKSWIRNLEYLFLDQNCCCDGDLVEFFEDGGPQRLRVLTLASNHFTDRVVKAIAAQRREHLEGLDLSDNPVTDAGLKLLAASPNFPKLEWLGLARTQITDAGLEVLAESPNFPCLQSLNVGNPELTLLSVMALHRSTKLNRLKHLQIDLSHPANGSDYDPPELRAAFNRFGFDTKSPDQQIQELVDQVRQKAPELAARFRGASNQEIAELRLVAWWDCFPEFYIAFLKVMGNDSAGLIDRGTAMTDVPSLCKWYGESKKDFQRFNPLAGLLPISLPSEIGEQTFLNVTEPDLPVYSLNGPVATRMADGFLTFLNRRTEGL